MALTSAAALAWVGCDPTGPPSNAVRSDAGASPNLSAQPRQLATHDVRAAGGPLDADAGHGGILWGDGGYLVPDAAPPPPTPLAADEVVPAEQLRRRELSGVVLEASWHWREIPAPAKVPELSKSGLDAARRAAALSWRVELADVGRLRVVFDSVALPLPEHSELLSRTDRYGTFVLWPNRTQFRVIAPGALRATVGERRVDVTPLTNAEPKDKGQGSRMDQPTRKLELESTLGRLELETAKLPEAGSGGELLCRLLVEVAGIAPSTTACVAPEVVLYAELAWKDGGGLAFEVTSISKRTDLPAEQFLVPPPGARYVASGIPASPEGIFFTRDELASFRTGPAEVPLNPDPTAPGEGFVAANQSDRLLYVLLDGVPVAMAPPWGERYLIGPPAGRYSLQWRTFLGDFIGPAEDVQVPGRFTFGAVDAGSAPTGPDAGG